MHKKQKRIVISGYYGFDNFGDDAILYTIVSGLKKADINAEITAFSSNPTKTKREYQVDSVYTFDYASVFKKILKSDFLISGGGSLLQNSTSSMSLFYYLALIFVAKLSGKKVFVYAQGIGPVNGKLPRFLTSNILKMVDKITVRDLDSQNLLNSWNIKSVLTADPVWGIDIEETQRPENDKINVGVQLREWSALNEEKLRTLAEAVKTYFGAENYKIKILPLQEKMDNAVCVEFQKLLQEEFGCSNTEIVRVENIFEQIKNLNDLDLLIGMRFHACLVTIKQGIPTFALSYDPKVEALALDSGIPYVDLENMDKEPLFSKIEEFKEKQNELSLKLKDFSAQRASEANKTNDLLLEML